MTTRAQRAAAARAELAKWAAFLERPAHQRERLTEERRHELWAALYRAMAVLRDLADVAEIADVDDMIS